LHLELPFLQLLLLPLFSNVSSISAEDDISSSRMIALGSLICKRSGTGTGFNRCQRLGGQTIRDAFAVMRPRATCNNTHRDCVAWPKNVKH